MYPSSDSYSGSEGGTLTTELSLSSGLELGLRSPKASPSATAAMSLKEIMPLITLERPSSPRPPARARTSPGRELRPILEDSVGRTRALEVEAGAKLGSPRRLRILFGGLPSTALSYSLSYSELDASYASPEPPRPPPIWNNFLFGLSTSSLSLAETVSASDASVSPGHPGMGVAAPSRTVSRLELLRGRLFSHRSNSSRSC